eukprot:SM000276S10296  [mRNA]  locus=s276:152588:154229:- [translate_table: standard]
MAPPSWPLPCLLLLLLSSLWPAGAGVSSESQLRAALLAGGPVVVNASFSIDHALPTIRRTVSVSGDVAACSRLEDAKCTISAKHKVRHYVVAARGKLILRHLILSNGQANNSGGSILVTGGGRLDVQDVIFRYNYVPGPLQGGGAIEVTDGSYASITRSFFQRNVAGFGAAIDVSAGSTVDVSYTRFHNNSASVVGGGIAFVLGSKGVLIGNVLTRNEALNGGAVYVSGSKVAFCAQVAFLNEAAVQGPAILAVGNTSQLALCLTPPSYAVTSQGANISMSCTTCLAKGFNLSSSQ